MKQRERFRGLSAILSFLLVLFLTLSMIAYQNYGMIDTFFGATRTKTVGADGEDVNLMYYKSEFADSMADITSKSKTLKMEQAVAETQVKVAEEGVVLLKNEGNALPLAKNTPITLFGNAACGMEDGHNHLHLSKKKDASSLDAIPTVWFDDAMESQFDVNRAVIDNAYSYDAMWHAGTNANRCSCWSQTPKEGKVDDVKLQASSWAEGTKYYGGVAVVNFFRWASEGREAYLYQDDTDTPAATGSNTASSNRHMLALSKNEEDLLLYLKEQKDAGFFSEIVVCLTSDLGMELDYVYDEAYGIDAFIKVGIPGNVGYTGLANVMAGDATPSGHLVDTYAADCFSAPSTVGASYLSPSWTNWNNGQENDVLKLSSDAAKDGAASDANEYYSIYGAGIYLGYKYYESRYADCIAGDAGALSSVGSYRSGASWNYADEVTFSFGYGLSYTNFEQTLEKVEYDAEKDVYNVSVKVSNIGDYPGRSVVQVYAQTPYGAYEKQNNVEKSAIQLVGFAKTDVLPANESVTVEIPVKRYFLASYDANNAKGYLLSAGDYYLSIGDDAHDAINNVLAKQGKSGMTDLFGNLEAGDASKVYTWNQADLDLSSYNESVYGTGVEVTNRFDHVDINSYENQSYTYLSRKDWANTYPTIEKMQVELTAEMANDMDCDWYQTKDTTSDWYKDTQGAHESVSVSDFNQTTSHASDNSDVTKKFIEMKDVAFDDDEAWNAFLDQFTVSELISLYPDNNGYAGVAALAVPAATRGDDGTCVLQAHLKAYDTDGLAWPSQVVVSCTWNVDRYADHGSMVAEQAIFSDCEEIWWGGGNMHQVPWGGRNMQYYSEDAVLAYYEGAAEAKALQAKGVAYSIKHMALNDTEAHRESTATFCNEQAVREIYLRSFEGTMIEGGGMGCMMGFNRMGLKFCPTDYNLMTKVVRQEWGWKGHFTTDADSGIAVKDHYLEQLIAGIDYTCWEQTAGPAAITSAINGGDGYILQQMRRAAKYTLYVDLHTISVNGLSANTRMISVTPAWQIAVIAADVCVGLGAVVCLALYAVSAFGKKRAEA